MIDDNDEHGFWGDEPSRPTRRHAVVQRSPQATMVDDHDDIVIESAVGPRSSWYTDVDPVVKRIGLMLLVAALLVPVALALRGDDASPQLRSVPPVTDAVPVLEAAPAASTPSAPRVPVMGEGVGGAAAAAPAAAAVVSHVKVCTTGYKVVTGDFWIRIAKLHGISLRQLLAANNARTGTPIYPGRTVCLPAGVQARTRPAPAAAPATTVAPTRSTTAPKAAPPQIAAAPATTPPATAAPARSYTQDEVIQIIRSVWPDELEERAIQIATRESNLKPGVRNYCCFGLFQMYFDVHKKWLGTIGVTSSSQLYDPTVNANAALALYNRAGGWGPWQ